MEEILEHSSEDEASGDGEDATPPPLFEMKKSRTSWWTIIKLIAPSAERGRDWNSKDATGAWCTKCKTRLRFVKGNVNSVKRHILAAHPELRWSSLDGKNNDDAPSPKRARTMPQSVAAFRSAGNLNIGLNSFDLANMYVNGLTLSTANRLNPGSGPNSQLGMQLQGLNNFSRKGLCGVEQNLRFYYKDIDQLPKVLEDIVQEIKDACPTVITDGSHPLRAVFMNYRDDHLQVVVTAHFRCRQREQEYYDTHQSCLFAINNAVKKNDLQFVTTSAPQV